MVLSANWICYGIKIRMKEVPAFLPPFQNKEEPYQRKEFLRKKELGIKKKRKEGKRKPNSF